MNTPTKKSDNPAMIMAACGFMSSQPAIRRHHGRGRPATGRDPVIATRLAQGMIVKVDKWAEGKDLSRSEAIRALIERGLKQK
jgi:hypothetical protein